jgi:ABC-2 type transport system permease protein
MKPNAMKQLYRSLRLFRLTAYFTSLRYVHYPYELFAGALVSLGTVFVIAVFWQVVAQFSPDLDARFLLSYYLIVSGFARMFFTSLEVGQSIHKSIRLGEMNADLTRPVHPYLLAHGRHIGWMAPFIVPSLLLAIIGVLIYNTGSLHPGLILVSIMSMFVIITALNAMAGCIGFYIIEASGVKNAISLLIGFMSGTLIPISLMPEAVQIYFLHLPFASVIYLPVSLLQGIAVPLSAVLSGALWAVVMAYAARRIWNRSIKHYEAVGL